MRLLIFIFLVYLIVNKVFSFIKKNTFFNKNFVDLQIIKYTKRKKFKYRLLKKKDNEIEKYIPYIYKDIAPYLKDLVDEEYSYKDLVNAYFPETIEREKNEKKKKNNKKNDKKKINEKELKNEENYIENLLDNDNENNNNEIIKKMQNVENINNIADDITRNEILDETYEQIKNSLKEIYFAINNQKIKEKKINYIELAKKKNDLLSNSLLNNYSPLTNNTFFDFFGVFYDNEKYKDEKKLKFELEKILSLYPIKNNENLIENINNLMKKKIPPVIRNFLLKYKNMAIKFKNFRNSHNYKEKVNHLINISNHNNENLNIKNKEININEQKNLNNSTDKNSNDNEKTILNNETDKNSNESKEKINSMYKDINKVIMTLQKNLNNDKKIKNETPFLDYFYEIYKKHKKYMNIKNNKLIPQKDNYDFLTFMHEHFEDYNFIYNEKFDYNFNENINKIKKTFDNDMELKNMHNENNTNENNETIKINETMNINENNKNNENDPIYFRKTEEKRIYKEYLLKDIIKKYNENIFNIYKPNNIITNNYNFFNYIDMEKHEKQIDVQFNKYTIFNYYDEENVYNTNESIYVGKLIYGKIIEVNKNMAYVDINYAFYAEIHIDQIPSNIKNIKHVFKENDVLIFEIYKIYTNKIYLTLKNIEKIYDLNKIYLYAKENKAFYVFVNSVLRNGVYVCYNDINTFIHISALSDKYKIIENEQQIVSDSLLNKKIKVICTNINKLNFSNLLYEQNEQFNALYLYKIIEAKIIHISKYGVLIKYQDLVGIMHISECSKKKIENINNLFKINEIIKGLVINIDYDNKKFSISTKILETPNLNFIDNKKELYDNIEQIAENIRNRQKITDENNQNIKNQLLSLMDLYKNENGEKDNIKNENIEKDNIKKENIEKDNIKKEDIEKDNIKKEEIEKDNIENENIEKQNYKKNITNNQTFKENLDEQKKDEKQIDEDIKDNSIEKKIIQITIDDKKKKNNIKDEIPINIHNEMIPYLIMKNKEYDKTEIKEEKKPIIWDLSDNDFLNSNSPIKNIQFLEYQWSFLIEHKWINFSYYINRIINYYFNINDDFFTYKEKDVIYEIDFTKNIRINLESGIYNKIRKNFLK